MLATSIIEEIDRLLQKGELSQRKIAAALGVSRGVVGAIAAGRRGLYGRERMGDGLAASGARSSPKRCPRCGYRIYPPCLVCRVRKAHERQMVLRLLAAIARTTRK